MALAPGSRLRPYEIVAPIGAGGMGEVYRALDKRLDRTVAIKTLPASLALLPELRERFDWSPDGSRLAFASDHGHTGLTDIYVMPLDGSGRDELLLRAEGYLRSDRRG